MAAASRSRFLISESALKLSLTPPPSATPTGSVSCASSASSSSSSSFAVRRKQFRPTSVPADPDQPRVHEFPSLVSLGIVLVVSGAPPDPYTRRSLKRPHRAIDREPKERHLDGQPREQPRYRPPPPDAPLPMRRCQRPIHTLARKLPLYHHVRDLPPLPLPVDPEAVTAPTETHQATRSSGRTRRPPPRNLEHLIVAVSNTAKQRQGSPAKKRKVVVLATDEMDVDVDAESETGSKKKNTDVDDSTPPVEEESGRARRAARRSGGAKDHSVTPTPPPQVPAEPAPKSRAPSSQVKKPVSTSKPASTSRRVTRRNSDETSSEEKDAESAPVSAPPISRRTSARKAGVDHTDAIPVSVRA